MKTETNPSFTALIDISLELPKGPIVYALQKYDFFALFPINPSTLVSLFENLP